MPTDYGVWLHDADGAAPFRPAAREYRPESTIVRGEVRSTLRPLVDGQLVTEGEIIEDEISSFPR
jgi:hypothetical protein